MAAPEGAILLRTCKHDQIPNTPTVTDFGYALKCENVSISYAKTPIQVPIPQQAPQIIDLGIYRPSISVSGVVDTVGGNTAEATAGFEGMESLTYLRTAGYGGHATARKYFVPYKNALEDFARKKLHSSGKPIELEWGDASQPLSSSSVHTTGGAIYLVALQQFRVQVDAAKEDRYAFSLQFVVGDRKDAD